MMAIPSTEEIPLSDSRIGRVYFKFHSSTPGIADGALIGQLIRELKGVEDWHGPVANVVTRSDGTLWIERASFDTTSYPVPIPDSYLASDLDSLRQFASLFFTAAQLAFVPRSQQWRATNARKKLNEWLRTNDPRCLDDPESYLNELRSDDY